MTPLERVALIVCGAIVILFIVCCGGLLVLNAQTPPPAPATTQMPFPWETK